MRSGFKRRAAALAWAVILLAGLGGCFQLETRVKLLEDGSATITERMRFSRRMLDLGGKEGGALEIVSLLNKEAALERAKSMGKGATLVSHEVREVEEAAKESLAVYSIPDLNDFQYVSPFLAHSDYGKFNTIKAHVFGVFSQQWHAAPNGSLAVAFRPFNQAKGESKPKEGEAPSVGPGPAELQVYREMIPLFRDLLKDFKVRFTFEAYTTIGHTMFGRRNPNARSNFVDLINFTGRDQDKFGQNILENEEVMLELICGKYGSKNIAEHVKDWPNNNTLPVFLPWGASNGAWGPNDTILFRPSRPLFDKHFTGKTLTYYPYGKETKEPATFEAIGLQSDPSKK